MFRKLCMRIQFRMEATRMNRNQLINGKCLFLTVCFFSMVFLFGFQKSSEVIDIGGRKSQVYHNDHRNRTLDRRMLLADPLKNKINGNALGMRQEGNIPENAVNQQILRTTISEEKHLPNNMGDFLYNLNKTKNGQDRTSLQTETKKSNGLLSAEIRALNYRLENVPDGQTKVSGQPALTALKDASLYSAGINEVNNRDHAVRLQNISRALCRRNLPDVLIIGAPKCGTAALAKFLSFHPNVAIIPGIELNFFSDQYDKGFKWYQNQMPCSQPGQITVERSSHYFVGPEVPERVQVMSKWTKLILIVCEPVRRLISQFTMVSAAGKTSNKTFTEYLFKSTGTQLRLNTWNYMVKASDYSQHFLTWLKLFPFQRIHIVDGDNLTKQPFKEVSAVEQFLDIGTYFKDKDFIFNSSKGFYCFKQDPSSLNSDSVKLSGPVTVTEPEEMFCLGKKKGVQHVDVSDILIQFFKQYFKPYNEKFYQISKRKFDW